MPASGFAFRLLGLSATAVGMPAILPQGVAGCSLLTTRDFVEAYSLAGPSLTTRLAIPNSLSLQNLILHEQVVPLELAANGSFFALTSTNVLVLTIGSI